MEGGGGPWTLTKLAKVREYLLSYQDVMLNQDWVRTVYVDAFCGRGQVRLRGSRDFTEGSALQALALPRPFSRYHLIEKSKASLDKLRDEVSQRYHDRAVRFHPGDVNDILPSVVRELATNERAVIFADPYGMQLKLVYGRSSGRRA